jgi:uncharacterized membrane protein YdbT with pleckstrin-like domain
MSWRESVLQFMKVPPRPEPPPGSPPRIFRAAPAFFSLKVIRWLFAQLAALAGLLWALTFIRYLDHKGTPDFVVTLLKLGEIIGWTAFAFEFVIGWMIVRLDFELRWYMVSDRAIRIREGITTIREKTIALANIQNIAVRQGPLQRLLGIADVEVKTAGGGSGSQHDPKNSGAEPMHVAYFRGVSNAEEIRDLVREGVRRQKNAGLGDPDEVAHVEEPSAPADLNAAVAELLEAAKRLRAAVS